MTLDDDVLKNAKQQAVNEGVTVSEVINRTLRHAFANQTPTRCTEPTVVYDPGTPRLTTASWDHRLRAIDDDELGHAAGLTSKHSA